MNFNSKTFPIRVFGIYWPDLDEDIEIKGLLDGKKSTESEESFRRWLQDLVNN